MRCCPAKRVNLVGTLVDEEPEEEDLFIGLAAILRDAEQLGEGGNEYDAHSDDASASGSVRSSQASEQCAVSWRCAQGARQCVAVDTIKDQDVEERGPARQDLCWAAQLARDLTWSGEY